jgi:hypothetical protein
MLGKCCAILQMLALLCGVLRSDSAAMPAFDPRPPRVGRMVVVKVGMNFDPRLAPHLCETVNGLVDFINPTWDNSQVTGRRENGEVEVPVRYVGGAHDITRLE